ncbi:MAG: class I SAM-dependent methyltransferase [Cyanothece sp. SIO2G6]|nr:class I SAM-dependent methyltransferase [Cyanothece sp. SIO2G6]
MEQILAKLTYQAFQYSKSYLGLNHKTLTSRVRELVAPPKDGNVQSVSAATMLQYRDRFERLLDQDWTDAEKGIYPTSLLFDTPWGDIAQYYPQLLLDLPQIWDRSNNRRFNEFSQEVKTEGYPQYYVRNFHYQTDGYLSDQSANLYDLQVEILFNGCADPMRRRILAPLKAGLESMAFATDQPRILDVACGTGRTLRMLRSTFPDSSLYGVDLSPSYLRKANQLLSELPGELPQLLQANAEELPYTDDYFHGITCVFLFHELPAPVRQKIINECYRTIQPGGTFIICDSVQSSDSPEMKPMMENFQAILHEPFYNNYVEDSIDDRLQTAGFEVVDIQIHLASKYWIARKPA